MSTYLSKILSRLFPLRQGKKRPIIAPRKVKNGKRLHGRQRLELDSLEARVVPAAPLVSTVLGGTVSTTVVGTVYEDLDKNGIKSPGENGISGWTVYLDLDNSGTLNTDATGALEPSAVTNRDGDYAINHLAPGVYRVVEVAPAGWTPTSPESQDIVVLKDKDNRADFFNFSGGAIVGSVWNDLNGDGVRATDPTTGEFTEPGLADWMVFLDANNNRFPDPSEPTTLTDANGNYAFSNLPPGDYEVTEVLPSGWEISPTFDTRQTATVIARSQASQDFANFSLLNGSIQGTIWNDLNADGVRQTDPATSAYLEPGLEGWTVFLDTNNNRTPDASEPTTITDSNGHYSFISLPAGDYEVTEVLPSGWNISPTFDARQTVTVFGGEASLAQDFANFTVLNGSIRGTVWNDLNRDGVRDVSIAGTFSDPGLSNWTVYLDLNRNRVADPGEPVTLTDANGQYIFLDLQVGDYEVHEVLPTGWEATTTYSDHETVTVYSGAESMARDFANFNVAVATAGSVSGTVWNDLNGNGVRDIVSGTGSFTDPGSSGWTVFIDRNGNGVLDATEPATTTAADGGYTISGVLPGSATIIVISKSGWRATAPASGSSTIALKNGENATGIDFGQYARQDAVIRGTVFADGNKNQVRDASEKGLAGITVYLDLNNNSILDAGEPQITTSADQFYTPAADEAGAYAFSHLAAGTYTVRYVLPSVLSATPASEQSHIVTVATADDRAGVDCAGVFRATEIHGIKFDDVNGDHLRQLDEPGVGGVTVFVDLNRDDIQDASEPTTVTAADGSYSFSGLNPGAYVVREVPKSGYQTTYPTTTSGILWPQGTSNPAVGDVSPGSITAALAIGATYQQTVTLTLPNTGALTNMVDVFLLFDDTGSFVNNSPIVRSAFPDIISQLQASLPGIDLGFGVGRFEEYANFAYEYSTGRPFILNQPIVAANTAGYMTAIQAALSRTTPGYGGDQPETDIEALYQLVTGLGFDGNNNGSVLDSGVAGLASTQLNPGNSGDVPSFASFQADSANGVMASAGNVGGGGFRSGSLPIILVATDTGFAYQPNGETTITGVGGVSLPVSALTQTSRPTTPFNSGAGFQQTVTGLNALGALVIGLGTNPDSTLDPRQGLESLSKLTGAVNRSGTTIANGTADAIAPGDPLYFQIASGFSSSVSNGVVSAIQNAVTNVAVDIAVQASDPRVTIVNHTGVKTGIGAGQKATFDIEFIGDGMPRRFDLQFVRAGTNVVLGSIPVVLGTPIAGSGYEFEDLAEGEIHNDVDFGSHQIPATSTTPTLNISGGAFTYDGSAHAALATAIGADGAKVNGSFTFTYNGSTAAPSAAGIYHVVVTFASTDPSYSNATGTTSLTIGAATPTIAVIGGHFTFDGIAHSATATATGVAGEPVNGAFGYSYNGSSSLPTAAGVYDITARFTSADPNYLDATGSATLTIEALVPSTPTITIAGGTYTYDGAVHAATATATGAAGTLIGGSFAFTYNGSANLPTNAGTYTVAAIFTSTDPKYTNATGSATLTIDAAIPTVSVNGGAYIFDGTEHSATATTSAPGTFAYTYNGATTPPKNAGVYKVAATFTSSDSNYANSIGFGEVIIIKATPEFSNLNVPTILAGTSSVTITGHLAAGAVAPVGDVVTGILNGDRQSSLVDSNGNFTLTFATSGLPAGVFPIALTYAGNATNFNPGADGSGSLTIKAVSMSLNATGLDISAIAGAPVTRPVATFTNPLGASASYSATISWGDGSTSIGAISESSLSISVVGSHTYADPGTANIRVSIVDNAGSGLSATTSSVATVSTLGLAAGKTKEAEFWQDRSGQNLLNAFNGSSSHTELGNWLASNFPNLYGANAGSFNLTDKSNAYIASLYKFLWRNVGDGAATQVLATAFNVYATTLSLGGAQGMSYGFNVTSTGMGARTFNVGSQGIAVGVANNTKLNVFELLRAVDRQAKNGVLYAGNRTLQSVAKSLFDKLNSI